MTLSYQTNENDQFVAVEFGILSGILETGVFVELFFADALALSKFRHSK